jgi:hypothetical protein
VLVPTEDTAGPGGRLGVTGNRSRLAVTCATALLAVACLVAGAGAAAHAHAEMTRKPTAAELSAASAAGLDSRWQRWPAGRIFPARLGYTTDLLTQETAQRLGIAAGDACAPALDSAVAVLARRSGCRAALRASYLDQLGGVVYTLAVLAFPDSRAAARFLSRYPAGRYPVTGLRALGLPGTPAAAFSDAARQATSGSLAGPYVVLTVAGYADGRPAGTAREPRASVFSPAAQLGAAIGAPLAQPVAVSCTAREWSC